MRGGCAGALALPAPPCPSAVSLRCETGVAHPRCASTAPAVWVSALALPRDSQVRRAALNRCGLKMAKELLFF